MGAEYYKFYEKKFKVFFELVFCVLFIIGSLWIRQDTTEDPFNRMLGSVGAIFFAACLIVFLKKLISSKPFVEITPEYIKIGSFEKLLWADIVALKEFKMRGQSQYLFEVKDPSQYKLTRWQKITLALGYTPFYLSPMMLHKKDREELKRILKERIPDCNLD